MSMNGTRLDLQTGRRWPIAVPHRVLLASLLSFRDQASRAQSVHLDNSISAEDTVPQTQIAELAFCW